jgi:hypothetical protein
MRIPIDFLNQYRKIAARCERLIRLPFERRPLPKQPPLTRLAIESQFRNPVIHPSRRIVPYHPHLDNQHILARHDIPCAQAKTAAVFERRAAERQSWQQELQWLRETTADF